MNGEHPSRARANGDGSLDVWVRGRRLHFPGGGRKPSIADDATPPAEAGEVPNDVLTDLAQAMTTVSHDGWYIRFSPSVLEINRTRARRFPTRVFYRTFGRDRG